MQPRELSAEGVAPVNYNAQAESVVVTITLTESRCYESLDLWQLVTPLSP